MEMIDKNSIAEKIYKTDHGHDYHECSVSFTVRTKIYKSDSEPDTQFKIIHAKRRLLDSIYAELLMELNLAFTEMHVELANLQIPIYYFRVGKLIEKINNIVSLADDDA